MLDMPLSKTLFKYEVDVFAQLNVVSTFFYSAKKKNTN